MRNGLILLALAALAVGIGVWSYRSIYPGQTALLGLDDPGGGTADFSGTESCRECHEQFYRLWAPSHHGLAMQPFTPELARSRLTVQSEDLVINDRSYRAEFDDRGGYVRETTPEGTERYPMVHAMGGKNVYYFLTPMDRGRLQVLPLAYDVKQQAWYDTAASAMRHFTDVREEAIGWREQEFTFNTSCYGCHVSQLEKNYDVETGTYHTEWSEPGINCEACHGSAAEHVRVCTDLPAGQVPDDIKIDAIRRPKYTAEQASDACASCHSKGMPITGSFPPGDLYFDHFDLSALEHPDYYPDGRDLGENYTYTHWLMNPCAKSGEMDCIQCHTSSGRYRFEGENANDACMPCHAENVRSAAEHSHHPEGTDGSRCISCHMPMTDFARMQRSDHSMLPPAPSATIAYGSPNACNICHQDRDALWADRWVRRWRERDYQAPVLARASLIEAARKGDWSRLPDILAYLDREDHEEVFAASLIRLLRACPDERKWPVLLRALEDPSPLVRASAADALRERLDDETLDALLKTTQDESRLVRIRAASALAGLPQERIGPDQVAGFDRAVEDLIASRAARPDQWSSHYNMGNFYLARREIDKAISSFETAIRQQPDAVMPYVNLSLAYNTKGRNADAERSLRKALSLEPHDGAINLNLGLLLGELGRSKEAIPFFRTAATHDPQSAVAAFNLGVAVAGEGRLGEAIEWCRRAYRLRPEDPKYGYTLAFYLNKNGNTAPAAATLEEIVSKKMPYPDAYAFLGEIYEGQGKKERAIFIYKQALQIEGLPPQLRDRLTARIRALSR